MAERLLTIPQVAEVLGTDKNRVYSLVRHGHIRCMKVGHYKVRESEVDAFIQKFDGKDVNDPMNIKDVDICSVCEEREV